MAEFEIAKEVGSIILSATRVAYDLYKTFRERQDSRGRFAKCAAVKLFCTPKLYKALRA